MRLYQTNNLGDAVGYFSLSDGDSSTSDMSHAMLHDPAATATSLPTAIDLCEMAACRLFYEGAVLDGWVIASATDINDDGVIVGYLFPEGSPWSSSSAVGYTLDTHASPDAPLPDPSPGRSFIAHRRLGLLVSSANQREWRYRRSVPETGGLRLSMFISFPLAPPR